MRGREIGFGFALRCGLFATDRRVSPRHRIGGIPPRHLLLLLIFCDMSGCRVLSFARFVAGCCRGGAGWRGLSPPYVLGIAFHVLLHRIWRMVWGTSFGVILSRYGLFIWWRGHHVLRLRNDVGGGANPRLRLGHGCPILCGHFFSHLFFICSKYSSRPMMATITSSIPYPMPS